MEHLANMLRCSEIATNQFGVNPSGIILNLVYTNFQIYFSLIAKIT